MTDLVQEPPKRVQVHGIGFPGPQTIAVEDPPWGRPCQSKSSDFGLLCGRDLGHGPDHRALTEGFILNWYEDMP